MAAKDENVANSNSHAEKNLTDFQRVAKYFGRLFGRFRDFPDICFAIGKYLIQDNVN